MNTKWNQDFMGHLKIGERYGYNIRENLESWLFISLEFSTEHYVFVKFYMF